MQEQGYISVFILLLPLCNECVKSCWSLYLLDMCAPFSSVHNSATWPPPTIPPSYFTGCCFLLVYICALKYNCDALTFPSLYLLLLCCYKRRPISPFANLPPSSPPLRHRERERGRVEGGQLKPQLNSARMEINLFNCDSDQLPNFKWLFIGKE